jgi:hypothetical protein
VVLNAGNVDLALGLVQLALPQVLLGVDRIKLRLRVGLLG